ncbi:type VII secretion target [Rhodococcus sp. Z13]|uniref:Type VII secretion target n=1 Tax=Rhodococcus sacchari TaxID=2962047 RepID=A0ACD4DDC0_9NOCA|nr:type VII secretion target [Rhodococcus sp. Z13]UYP17974.1 type VII secretion target [Rhodococcus sp. Z13]
MTTPHDTVRFDGPAVLAIAARLSASADDVDREVRRAFGAMTSGEPALGPEHRESGAGFADGLRRVRAACAGWAAALQTHADALRAAADLYTDHELRTVTALADTERPRSPWS